jgi:hypothetical protein
MEFSFEFVDKAASRFNFRIRIETKTQEGEREMTYEHLRKIHLAIKPHNPTAASLFPRFKMWKAISRPRSLDLERFQQVFNLVFVV